MGRIISVSEFSSSPYGDIEVDNLNAVIARAEDAIESKLGRKLAVNTYTELAHPQVHPEKSRTTVFTKNRPIVSLTQIRRRRNSLYDWQIVDPTRYIVEYGPGYVTSYLPQYLTISGYDRSSTYGFDQFAGFEVEITYTAGLSTIPEDIKQATMLQVVRFAYQDTQMFTRTDDKDPAILYFDADIEALLAPYRQLAMVYQ